MKKVVPIHIEACNCLLDVFASIVIAADMDCEFLFSKLWTFNCDSFISSEQKEEKKIGNIFGINPISDNEILEPYKIQILPKNITDTAKMFSLMESSFEKRLPVIVGVDAYYVPWNDCYHTVHNIHYFLASEFDREKEALVCIDPFFLRNKIEYLSYDNLKKGIGELSTVEISDKKVSISKEEVMKNLHETLQNAKFISVRIEEFADIVEKYFDRDNEYLGFGTLWNAPIIWSVTDIANSRVLYAMYLQFLQEKYNIALSNVSKKFKECGSEWNIVRALLFKIYHNDTTKTRQKLVNQIRNIAILEKNLFQDLSKMVGQESIEHRQPVAFMKKQEEIHSLKRIDLCKYFNNKAFISMEEENDMTLKKFEGVDFFNMFFLKDEILFKNNFGEAYLDEYSQCRENDNISCAGEKIRIPKSKARGIIILGSSIYIDSSGKMILYYEDGSEEVLEVSFASSEICDIPEDHVMALKTPTVKWINQSFIKEQLLAKLYTKQIMFEESTLNIESIMLPDNINMHIFAMWVLI